VNSITQVAQPDDGPRRTFRNVLSGVAALAALLVGSYEWIVFPAANARKYLELTGTLLLLVSILARARWRKPTK